jgi:glycosyltransferase involved in cell wall biosynthesis
MHDVQKISIAMAAYNGAAFLPEQLASIAAQTLAPYELVITDDGSTDASIAIIEDFAASAPFPVRLHRNHIRLGHKDNFLRAAQLCTGGLIAFCDQDDIWHPDKLRKCAATFTAPDVLLCIHSGRVWHGGENFGFRLPDFQAPRLHPKLSLDPLFTHPGFAMVFRKSVLDITDNAIRPGDILAPAESGAVMSHDQWIYFLAAITGKIVTLPDELCQYRQHGANACGAEPKRGFAEAIGISLRMTNYAQAAARMAAYAAFVEPFAPDAAAKFCRRAVFNRRRDDIYAAGQNPAQRLRAFSTILLSGGYLPDKSKTRLGPRAGIKDFCTGITGFHKHILKTRSAEYPARG